MGSVCYCFLLVPGTTYNCISGIYTLYTFSAEFIKGAKKYCLSAHKTRQNVAGMSVKVIEQAKRKKELIVVPVFQLAWCFALILIGINKKNNEI